MKYNFDSYQITAEDLTCALQAIDALWPKLLRYTPNDDKTLIGLPHPYIVPSMTEVDKFAFNELYYWDTYFILQGLYNTPQEKLILGIIDDFHSLYERFHIIPNASRFYFTGKSQPPLLTSMLVETYERTHDKQWLIDNIAMAKEEYRSVWMNIHHPNSRLVYKSLSRYYHVDVLHDLAESESGWDHTPRFYRRCLDFLPIDLNCLLYKYEMDFAHVAVLTKETEEAKAWLKRANQRKAMINETMWNSKQGFYFDYDYRAEKQGQVWSLAGFFAMWTGLASEEQAHRMVANLTKFEYPGGLATTTPTQSLNPDLDEQWAFPNGWAPLQYITIQGLIRYGYQEDATRLTIKWIKNNLVKFLNEGYFYEKYNVVNPNAAPKDGLYPSQVGFGWTNSIFARLTQDVLGKTFGMNIVHTTPADKHTKSYSRH